MEDGKKIINKFIEFNKKLLSYGIIDKSFNITKNFGLTKNKEVILTDLGEIFDDPKLIKRQLVNREWTKFYVAGCIKNQKVRDYFVNEMDKHFQMP